MLLRDDVFNVKRNVLVVVFVNLTVLATATRTFDDSATNGFLHDCDRDLARSNRDRDLRYATIVEKLM